MRNMVKTNDEIVLKGEIEQAVYKTQPLVEYENNPFIEALPPFLPKMIY